ncbi:MAG: hypothetical protein CL398_07375 [Acidiferrobacteraceae bacterium]|nr:hypothetical protein [Acidiferrobacteraceae bacterium]|tara:strand:- start:285 stop:485 length:201 start_codon:yes stop_codon:yes gene_type:complete
MFKTKASRLMLSYLVIALFNFTCFWFITDDAVKALKGLLVAYLLFGGLATSFYAMNNWVEKGDTDE